MYLVLTGADHDAHLPSICYRRATGRGETQLNSAGQHRTEIHTEQGSAGRGKRRRIPSPLPSKQWVGGSNPSGRAIFIKGFREGSYPAPPRFANAC